MVAVLPQRQCLLLQRHCPVQVAAAGGDDAEVGEGDADAVAVTELAEQLQRLFQPLAGRVEVAGVDRHDSQVAQCTGDAAGVVDGAGKLQRLFVEDLGGGQVAGVVGAVAEMVEGAGEVAFVAQLPPHGGRFLVACHCPVVVAVVLGEQARRPQRAGPRHGRVGSVHASACSAQTRPSPT